MNIQHSTICPPMPLVKDGSNVQRWIVFGSSSRCVMDFRGVALMVVILLLNVPAFSEESSGVIGVKEASVEALYKQALKERAEGKLKQAIETVATGIARNTTHPVWFAKSEMLSAELYLELGMTNSADVTARQIQVLYPGTEFAEKAKALHFKIEQEQMRDAE